MQESLGKRAPRCLRVSLVALLAIAVAAAMIACGGDVQKQDTSAATPKETKTTAAPAPMPTPNVISEARFLKQMRVYWGKDISGVKVSGSSDDVRLDVYTVYYPDSDVRQRAEGIARIAATTDLVLDKYPTTMITAYVWPKGENPDWYMTRARASFTDGTLDEPVTLFVDPSLK